MHYSDTDGKRTQQVKCNDIFTKLVLTENANEKALITIKKLPVISWSIVRLLLVLSAVFGLKSRQVDYAQAFLQA